MNGTIVMLNTSSQSNVEEIVVKENWGIETDKHGGMHHRQISLLPKEKVDLEGIQDSYGENIQIEGIDFAEVPCYAVLKIGDVELRVTQKGSICTKGMVMMPKHGVFLEVLKGGTIRKKDSVEVVLPSLERPFTAAVITLSDKGYRGERVDESGPAAREMLEAEGYEIVEMILIPDEPEMLKKELIRLADHREVDLVLTSGGTGFSMRDRTPEATMEIAERNAPGISEYMRMKSAEVTDRAMLSRGASVIRKQTLIINLPGSPRSVRENLGFIIHTLDHGLKILRGSASECARK